MSELPSFMHDHAADIKKNLSHGNYPTIPYRTTADAPYSPRAAKEAGHKKAPHTDKLVPHSKASKGISRQVKRPSRGHK